MNFKKILISIFIAFTSFLGVAQTSYSPLKKELDGNYVIAQNSLLKFLYEEHYDNDTLRFNIYNSKNQAVLSDSSLIFLVKKGINELTIPTNGSGFQDTSFYTLEVINTKKERFYLRFKNGVSSIVDNGLVLFYDFNDSSCYSGTGTSVYDLKSNHNGTIVGTPSYVSRNVGGTSGLTGNCMEFQGTQRIDLANNFNHTDWTISFWFHYRSSSNNYSRYWGMGGYRFELAITSGNFYFYDGGWRNTGVSVPTSGWHKVTFAYTDSPKKISFRIDGVEVYSNGYGRTMNTYAKISSTYSGGEKGNFYMGDIEVYNKYLSEIEELINYNHNKADYGH